MKTIDDDNNNDDDDGVDQAEDEEGGVTPTIASSHVDKEGNVISNFVGIQVRVSFSGSGQQYEICLLYTSDAARRYSLCRSRWSPYH